MTIIKGALLDPEDWERLIEEKEWKIATKDATAANSRLSPAYDVLRQNSLYNSISGLVDSASNAIRTLAQLAGRKTAEYQAEASLRRLVNVHGGKYTDRLREQLLQVHNTALKSKFSIVTRSRVLETQLRCLRNFFDARPHPMPAFVYKDLVEILSVVCSGDYPPDLVEEVWAVFLSELRAEGARELATALAQCDAGDVHLILRHLALCQTSAWKSLPASNPPESEEEVRQAAREAAFSWDTYHGYIQTSNAFYDLLEGLMQESSSLVHKAFDDTRLHLLWLKFINSSDKTLVWAWVIDAATSSFLTYPKRLTPELPIELDCLVLFVATTPNTDLTISAAQHIHNSIKPLGTAEPQFSQVQPVFSAHPAIQSRDLAHPALPFLLFASRLMQESRCATETVVASGILDVLCQLWRHDFPRATDYQTGNWVHPEKKQRAMRLASCLLLGAMATHEALYSQMAAKVVATDEMKQWFWDVTTYCLNARVHHPGAHWLKSLEALKPLAVFIMTNNSTLPGDVNREEVTGNDGNLIWLFQSSGTEVIDAQLRNFALDVLIKRFMAPASSWSNAINILSSCEASEAEPLTKALAVFVDHFVNFAKLNPSVMIIPGSDSGASSQPILTLSSKTHPKFMSQPLDRFIMLLSNASRKNSHVLRALGASDVRTLVEQMLAGLYDFDDIDKSSKDWRRRTCTEILSQRATKLD